MHGLANPTEVVCSASSEGRSEVHKPAEPTPIPCLYCPVCLQAADEYAGRLVSGHATSCPWRDTVCDAKLGKFPKLPARDVYVDFEQRYARLDGISHLPPLSEQAVAALQGSHGCGLLLLHLCKLLHAKTRSISMSLRFSTPRLLAGMCETSSIGLSREEVSLVLQKQLKAKSMTMQQPADPKASQAVSDVFQGLAGTYLPLCCLSLGQP